MIAQITIRSCDGTCKGTNLSQVKVHVPKLNQQPVPPGAVSTDDDGA